jgi:glutamyl-tRNA synthetase
VPPRLRFAPSPTGYLHVGGARTALFNFLYVRRHGGTFILRIEDTDVERSSADMVSGILQSMKWLGLEWDEGPEVGGPHAPYFQSERLDEYREAGAALVTSGHAYYCYCDPEELRAKRQAAEAAGGGWMYDRTCRQLAPDEVARREAAGQSRAIRFFVPEGGTTFDDLVHGPITIPHTDLEDFVILRSDGYPTYHLSVVVDDVAMAVTHVVRGDDHISNTPKQVLLYRAMAAPVPAFAHVPLILGPDKKRLSKRHGATSVGEYEKQGYLPEAMVNFLALLGWSPGGDRELFTREELIASFDLEGISGGNAVFNTEKLDWFNQQHIARSAAEDLLERLRPEIEAAGLTEVVFGTPDRLRLLRAVDLIKPRVRKLGDVVAQLRPFLDQPVERDAAAAAKYLTPDVLPHLDAWREEVELVTPFDAATLEEKLRALAAARGIKAGALIHATRVAVTGQGVSPGIFEVLELVGRDRAAARLAAAVAGATSAG